MILIPINIRKLQRLSIPVPPDDIFEHLYGYRGSRRFIAMYWQPMVPGTIDIGDHPVIDDGMTRIRAREWQAFLDWILFPLIAFALAQYDIGDSYVHPRHYLLLDRYSRRIYVGDMYIVSSVITIQNYDSTSPQLKQYTEPAGQVAKLKDICERRRRLRDWCINNTVAPPHIVT